MARQVSPNMNDVIKFDERLVDGDGDNLSVDTLELDAVEGITQSGGDRTPGWLSHSSNQNTLSSGATELIVTIEIDSTQVSDDTVYTLELIASDPSIGDTRYIDFAVRPQKAAPNNIYVSYLNTVRRWKPDGSNPNYSKSFSSDLPEYKIPLAATDNEDVIIGLQNRIERYDKTLNKQWENQEPAGDVEAITMGPDGFIYVADSSGKLIKVSRDGTLINTIRGTGGFGSDIRDHIIPVANGNVFVGDAENDIGYYVDQFGDQIWSKSRRLSGVSGKQDESRFAIVGDNGMYAYDGNGSVVWNSTYFDDRYGGGPDSCAYDPYSKRLAVLAGELTGFLKDVRLGIFDDNGNVLADTLLNDFDSDLDDYDSEAGDTAWDEDGNVFITLKDEDNDQLDGRVAKFNEYGDFIWNATFEGYNGSGLDKAKLSVPRFLG